MASDGLGFTAISDRALMVRGTVRRRAGRITGIRIAARMPLQAEAAGRRNSGDSEGLAIHAGGAFVSFEGSNNVWRYTGPDAPAPLPRHPGFDLLESNAGLEALAVDGQGRLHAIPERSGRHDRSFPVWRYDGAWSQPYALPRRGGFLVVGADFGPEGRLYVLERAFSGFGFRSRVRRFTPREDRAAEEATLIESQIWRHDNLEGISVWRDAAGSIRITMISDDNFNPLQKTELVEYRLP
jgi:hypothetical protein